MISIARMTIVTVVLMLCLISLVLSGTAFADRCMDNGDGTITDNVTGLMWQKATAGPLNWIQAMRYASGLSLGGNSDWWLPKKHELQGLYHSPCKDMMDVESGGGGFYWSSSTVTNAFSAWRFNFNGGALYVEHKSNTYYVRSKRSAH